ncbi:hypothetical protein K7X08_033996 [Anisodus acutangulus]|uniref:Uncharacterized protein n=1 Tax=Anisodus acutangulus TaxID=402998 RepID=A0A9Q1LRC9_9SOLA|nr:hypothetical protein K7X08_033996 [Anisodus acutangulus]
MTHMKPNGHWVSHAFAEVNDKVKEIVAEQIQEIEEVSRMGFLLQFSASLLIQLVQMRQVRQILWMTIGGTILFHLDKKEVTRKFMHPLLTSPYEGKANKIQDIKGLVG